MTPKWLQKSIKEARKNKPFPEFVFDIWVSAAGDLIVASDYDLELGFFERLKFRIRGNVLHFLFGWWWYA